MVELLECTQRDVEPVRKQIPVLIVEDEVLIRMHLDSGPRGLHNGGSWLRL